MQNLQEQEACPFYAALSVSRGLEAAAKTVAVCAAFLFLQRDSMTEWVALSALLLFASGQVLRWGQIRISWLWKAASMIGVVGIIFLRTVNLNGQDRHEALLFAIPVLVIAKIAEARSSDKLSRKT